MYEEILPFLAIGISVSGLLLQYFKVVGDMKSQFFALDSRVAKLETKTELFWNAVGAGVTSMLKHPHEGELDGLLDKFRDNSLNLGEARMLKSMLMKQASDRSAEYIAVILVLARLEQVIFDLVEKESKSSR